VYRRNLILACLVFFLLFQVTALRAQQGGVGSIIGELQLSRGDFPGSIFVELQFRGATITSVYSDDQGKFGFTGLGSDPYHVVIHDKRFYPVDQLVVLDTSISALSIAQIVLTPREPVKTERLPNHAQGSNPYLIDPSEYRRHFPRGAIKEFDRGVEADKNQKRNEAILHYQKSISVAPDFYPAHNNLGSAFLARSQFPQAQEQFEKVIQLNPSDAAAYFNLADLYLLQNHYQQAGEWVEQGLRREPDSGFGHFLQGSLYSRTGRPHDAETALRRCLELNPLMSQAHLALVNLYLQQQRSADAASELRIFLKAFPEDPFAPRAKQVLAKLEGATDNKVNP